MWGSSTTDTLLLFASIISYLNRVNHRCWKYPAITVGALLISSSIYEQGPTIVLQYNPTNDASLGHSFRNSVVAIMNRVTYVNPYRKS